MKIPIGTLCLIIQSRFNWPLGLECEVIGHKKGYNDHEIVIQHRPAEGDPWIIPASHLLPMSDGELLDKESEQTMTTLIQSFSDAEVE